MIQCNHIKKIYNYKKANAFEALHNVSLTIEDGEMVAIVGQSGAGKSTLIHIIAGIDSYEEGEYYINDILIKGLSESKLARIRNENIGIVMQDFALVENYTVIENVLLPLNFSHKVIKHKRDKAIKTLQKVGIEELADKKVNQLSGGQKQRTAIARAIVNEPDIVIADEPTGALDSKTSEEIMELFLQLNEKGHTIRELWK